MKKLKLLMAFCALLLGWSNASAQTDVTSTYIPNAGFEECTVTTINAAAGSAAAPTDISGGWTQVSSAAWSSSAVVAYGGTGQVNGVSAPSADNNENTGKTLGVSVGWDGIVTYKTANVTLPSGTYTLRAYANNQLKDVTQFTSKLGFVPTSGSSYISTKNSYTYNAWEADEVTFTLVEETEGYFQIGGGAISGGSGSNAKVFFDNISLTRSDISYPVDMTARIQNPTITGSTGWTCEKPNGGNGPLLNNVSFEYWGGNASGGTAGGAFDYYQTITGLPAGKYTVSAEMYNSTNGEGGAVFSATSGVYATNSSSTSVYKLVNVDGTSLIKYTTDEINVIDGNLRIGVKNQTTMTARWFVADNFTLTMTAAPDLSDFVEAYEAARDNANAVNQSAKMSTSALSNLQNALSTYGSVDETSISAMTEATEALNNATTAANTSIASYAVIAAGSIPDNSVVGWVCENAQGIHINTWSNEGNSDGSGMTTPFIENWVAKGSYLGAGKVYYQLNGLEPGEVYYAQALVRSYNEANSDAPNGPNFFINDVTTSLSEVGTTFTYSEMSGIYATLGGAATVGDDGILKLGVEIANDRNYNWVAFKNVSIQSMDDAFDAAVAKVTVLEGTVPTGVYNTAYAVVTSYSGGSYPTTAEGFETAISAIEAAAATAATAVSPYAAFNALKAKANTLKDVANDNATANGTLVTAISDQTTAVEAATTAEAINTAISALKSAMVTYVGVATPVGDGAKFDCTFMLTNPDVTGLSGKPAGWATEQEGGNFQVTTNAHRTDLATAYSVEYWSENARANDKFALYNTVTLPEGTYSMNCYAFASPNAVEGATNNAVYFYANDTQGSLINSTDLEEASISFVNSTEQNVKIGLKTMTGNQYRWMGIGYVELYKVPAKVYEISENAAWDYSQSGAGDVTLTRTIAANYNTVVFPFSMTQAEVEDKFGEDSKVYVISAFANDNITFAVQEGIQANKPCLLKATEAGTSYTLEGRTIVSAANAAPSFGVDGISMVGNYNASLTVPADANNYIVSGDALYLVNSAVTVKNTRAYFNVETVSPARSIRMSFDGITGIATVENGAVKSVETGDIYDISGRKVKKPSKGIYLMNGKKFAF